MVTGLIQAKLAYSPVVAITGLASSSHLGRDAFQEIDQQALFTPITKRTFTVPRADRILEFFKEAFRIAAAGRCGPVVVQIPRDCFAQNIEAPPQNPIDYSVKSQGMVNQQAIADICEMLRKASAPVIVAGAGVKWGDGSHALARLAARLEIPVVTSAGHCDVLANDHSMFFGQVGPRGNLVASRLTREADLIIALGYQLGFNTTFYTYNDVSHLLGLFRSTSIRRRLGVISLLFSVSSATLARLPPRSTPCWTCRKSKISMAQLGGKGRRAAKAALG